VNSPRTRKDDIVQLSDALIRTQGCNAFSYYDLAEALKLRPAAIHYHFPHKTDLLIAVARAAEAHFQLAIQEIEEEFKSPADQLQAFIKRIYQKPAAEGKLCIVLALGNDFTSLTPECSEALRNTATAILHWLSKLLTNGKLQGVFKFEGSARVRAQLLMAALSASLSLSRLYGKRIVTEMHQQLLNDIIVKPTAKRPSSRKK
jgi:TetR/AcrR family transcriptional regulator, transcriptional repressor for nem operon